MNVGFLGAELGRWDQALREAGGDAPRISALGLPFFEDERPLRGAGGLCDWRLGGRLSRLLGAGGGPSRFRGSVGDRLLMPSGPRLPWERIVLFGLGPSAGFDESRARVAARELLKTLGELCPAAGDTPATIALVPPGRSIGALSARQALEILLDEAPVAFANALPDLLIVESAAGQKEAAELARRHS